jgi:hypothetical protein
MFRTKTAAALVVVAAALASAGIAGACPPAYFAAHPAQLAQLTESAKARQLAAFRSTSRECAVRTYAGIVHLCG